MNGMQALSKHNGVTRLKISFPQIYYPEYSEAADVLLGCNYSGVLQHLLCGGWALQPAGVAHAVPW